MTNMQETPTSAGAELGKALVAALGLPAGTSKLTLKMDGTSPPTVEIEFFPDAEALREAAAAIQPLAGRYVLKDAGPATAA